MLPFIKTFFVYIGAIGMVLGALLFLENTGPDPALNPPIKNMLVSTGTIPVIAPPPATQGTATSTAPENQILSDIPNHAVLSSKTPNTAETGLIVAQSPPTTVESDVLDNTIMRIQNPYTSPPFPFETVNENARAALVNIFCTTNATGIHPITASGVIIDPRGIILTNAHVAQYVLLSQSSRVNLKCIIRQGAPARSLWEAEVLYIPPVWIEKHAKDILEKRSTGTGEHDYALLRIANTIDGSPTPVSFPYLSPDTREGIGFIDDPMLAASYPAEFISGDTAYYSLYPISSITFIKEFLTFDKGTVDVISIGGVAGAQGGSSGGAVVNAWSRLVGIISTTSEGATTAERDLRALTLSYIDKDIKTQSGFPLSEFQNGNIESLIDDFNSREAPALIQLLLNELP